MKTNTYGVIQPAPNHSPGQMSHQNSFGNGVNASGGGRSNNENAMGASPYDNALPMVEDFYG